MPFRDLLNLLPENERARLLRVAQIQKNLMTFYDDFQKDVSERFSKIVTSIPLLSRASLNAAYIRTNFPDFIDRKAVTLNNHVNTVFRRLPHNLMDLVVEQVYDELLNIRTGKLRVEAANARTIEAVLEDASSRIIAWNGLIRPQLLQNVNTTLASSTALPPDEVLRSLESIFTSSKLPSGHATPVRRARSRMLANTRYGIVNAANAAREEIYIQTMSKYDLSLGKMWWSSIDNCCISCAKLHGQIVEMGNDFEWEKLDLRITPFQDLPHPPLHPNCRCRIIPVTPDILLSTDKKRISTSRSKRIKKLHGVDV